MLEYMATNSVHFMQTVAGFLMSDVGLTFAGLGVLILSCFLLKNLLSFR